MKYVTYRVFVTVILKKLNYCLDLNLLQIFILSNEPRFEVLHRSYVYDYGGYIESETLVVFKRSVLQPKFSRLKMNEMVCKWKNGKITINVQKQKIN